MAVEQYASIDRSKVDKLPFIKGTYPLGYVNQKNDTRLGIVYEVNAASAEKIEKLLSGKDSTRKLVKGDRVFVLSGCKIPQFKIKEYLRGIGAIMVNNIEEATVFVGNERASKDCSTYNYEQLDSLSMIVNSPIINANLNKTLPEKMIVDEVVYQYYPDIEDLENVKFTKTCGTDNNCSSYTEGSVRYMQFITPYVARLLHAILSKKMVTITEECLFNQLPVVAKLDKDLYTQLTMMMDSNDEENQKTAHEILANSDWKDADLYLYLLARKHFWQINGSRFKNVRLFKEETEIRKKASTSEEIFLKEQLQKDKLTAEALDLLLPGVTEKMEATAKRISSSIFTVKIELKSEYANILQDDKFNKEIQPDENTEEDDI